MIREPKTKSEYMTMIKERESGILVTGISNCIGTSEYLVGEQCMDDASSIQNNHIRGFNGLGGMRMSETPKTGYIVAWNKNGTNYHTGVVKSLSPLLVSHRANSRSDFHKNQPIEEIKYEKQGLAKMFYVPTKLDKILGTK